ncbi:putative magnesium transporter NIPA9 isoform A [Micractinium conductrix]|uniref:Magnesium transporter NIPA9 isoform A n=1 Tax=Micractinium conductrix TaxID=554055 RepID=A0A2P6V199_9CHLO|nr:putative magnesium transporter NIPA9 isoform A [Micractinium conductrix]|eukprot:PSC67869.1 putative magnesium transporter NIPA9 isoform A [Micractinium conductrix]
MRGVAAANARLLAPARSGAGGGRPASVLPQRHMACSSSYSSSSSSAGVLLPRQQCSRLCATRSLPQPSSRRRGRRGAPRPSASAAAAGGAAEGSTPTPAPSPAQRRARELSLQQRWRAVKFALKEATQQLGHLPPVAALLAAMGALNARMQPLYDAWAVVKRKEEDLLESYNTFLAEETKRQWSWSKRYAKELEWWSHVPPFVRFFAATLVWQAFMPVSLAACVLAPLYYSWVLWDNWWVSPIFLATLLTAPMKRAAAMIWLAILITVVSSTACSVGKALQKEATRHLPRFSAGDRKILAQYLHSRLWVSGLAADVGGAVLQIAAFALAPVSIVQPVSGIGLVGLAVYSHLFLKERMHALEWGAVALAFVGTVGLGATSADAGNDAAAGGDARAAAAAAAVASEPGALRMLGVLLVLAAAVGAVSLLRAKHPHRQRRAGDRPAAASYGLQAGACFGLSAASCRIGFLLAQRLTRLWVAVGLAGSVALSSSGFVLQTCGFKEGSAVIVCTLAAVSSMVTGVVVGVLGLAEALPHTAGAAAVRLASWVCMLLGVAVLANGAGGTRELAAVVLSKLPAGVWKALPVSVAVAVDWPARRRLFSHPRRHAHHTVCWTLERLRDEGDPAKAWTAVTACGETPSVAFSDPLYTYQAVVLVKNVTWTTLSPGTSSGTVSAGATSNVKLATDTVAGEAYCSGSRWVAHLESSSSDGLRALHFEEIHTIGDTSHTNDQWVSSFTDGVVGYAGGASYPSLAVRGNTTMYLAFRLASPASLVVIVGSRSSFSSVTLSTTSITGNVRGVNAVDTAGRTYVAYENATSYVCNVRQWSTAANTWEQVGPPNFSEGLASSTGLAISPISNVPHVAYRDGARSNRLTVQHFDGSQWQAQSRGVHYTVSAAANVMLCAAGLAAFETLYPASTAGLPGALLQVCIAYGVALLIHLLLVSALQVAVPTADCDHCDAAGAHPSICRNPNFQACYSQLARALGTPDVTADARCRASQPMLVLASFAAIGSYLYTTALVQRRVFLGRLRAQRARPPQGSGARRADESAYDGPVPSHNGRACVAAYWLRFAIPAIGVLLSYAVFPASS